MKDKLTQKQQKFVDEFIRSGNAKQAAVVAGYSVKYAGENADKVLKNTKVMQYLNSRLEVISNDRIAGIQEVQEFWTGILRNSDEKTLDRLKASEFIAKTNGAFIVKTELNGVIGLNIIADYGDDNEED